MSDKQTILDSLTGKATPKAAKATSAKAQTPAQRKGFSPKTLGKSLLVKARLVWAQYQRDPKAPKVTERDGSWRRGPMLAVAYVWGYTSNADGDAKVQALQSAMGKTLTGPNGIMDFGSDNPIKRQKCMGTTIAANWQAKAAKDGVYFLKPTTPQARKAVQAIADQGKRTGAKPIKAAKGKTVKADPQRTNGSVTRRFDPAIRKAAMAAETASQRAERRAANRAKQAAQGKAEAVTTAPSAPTE